MTATESALLKQPLGLQPPLAKRAKGVYIYSDDGRDYLDGSGGAMTVSIGHGVEEVLAAMNEQAQQLCFTYRTQFSSEPAEELAHALAQLAPEGINQAFFVNSGSEATELAMRVAIQYWRARGMSEKTHILGRQISYHGMTMGSLSMSGHSARRADYGNLLPAFAVAPPPYQYRFPVDDWDAATKGAAAWEETIVKYGAHSVAAIIVEPIVGAAGGALTPPIGYLQELRRICDRHQILLIADEVITGMGRTGKWFGVDHDGISPDLIATGKGMTSGYTPMGAVLFADHVVNALKNEGKTAPFGHTFSANPLSAATCLAVTRYMLENRVLENVNIRSKQLEDGLLILSAKYPWLVDVRGRGLLWGFEFVKNPETKEALDSKLNANTRFVAHCFNAGLIVYAAGIAPYNNSVIISPPLTITDDELNVLLARLETGAINFAKEMNLNAD
jgi:adenosylmethionine-8-amino-7-oxononanoate aminotransferase